MQLQVSPEFEGMTPDERAIYSRLYLPQARQVMTSLKMDFRSQYQEMLTAGVLSSLMEQAQTKMEGVINELKQEWESNNPNPNPLDTLASIRLMNQMDSYLLDHLPTIKENAMAWVLSHRPPSA